MTETVTDQAVEQSVEDRIAARFGGLPQPEPTEEPEISVPETSQIEWEGKKYGVPKELEGAFLKNKDYTQKTQEIADERRQIQHVRELAEQAQAERAFSQSVSAEQQELAVIDAYLSQASKVDWAHMTTDQMLRQKVEIDSVKERREAVKASIDEKRGQFNDTLKTRIGELRAKAREMASKSITGFSEETEKSVRAYAASEGLSEAEIDNVLLDPRSFKVLWKASQFEKIKADTGKAVAQAERVVKPGVASERMSSQVASKLNLGKAMKGARTSGDKARIIEDHLAANFFKGHA
ncbi:MAG: hypothetical protein ACREQ5_10620 [Candidatus Dormibacteria bacterium]